MSTHFHISTNQQGDQVRTTGHNANAAPSPKAGLFATLCGLLRDQGTTTSKTAIGTRASSRSQNHDQRSSEQGVYEHDQHAYGGQLAQCRGRWISHVESIAVQVLRVCVKCAETVTTLCRDTPRRLSTACILSMMFMTLGLGTGTALAAGPPEKPVTEAPTANTGTGITFNGTLNPATKPQAGTYQFLYKALKNGAGCEGESATPGGAVAGLGPEHVTEPTAVEPDTEYTVCLAATNTEPTPETTVGNPIPFKTKALPPTVESESTSTVTDDGATPAEARLEATVNANNEEVTKCKFEYGTSSTLAAAMSTACEPATLEGLPYGQGVGLTVTGLTPKTTYYYRVLATNATGETKGTEVEPIKHFTTPLHPETPESKPANPIAANAATLNGVLNPGAPGDPGTYEFRYRKSATECQGGEPEEEKATPATKSLGAKEEAATAEVKELLPHTAYTFCLLAKNEAGEEALSAPETLTTPVAAPEIEETSTSVTDVSSESATLHAKLNPGGADTTYIFEDAAGNGAFAPVRGPGGETLRGGEGNAGAGITPVALETHLPGLAANTTYRFRLLATNSVETVPGEAVSFTTQPPAGEFVLPDNRQYEMVSPPEKEGAGIVPTKEQFSKAAASGDALAFPTKIPTESEPVGFGGLVVQNLATRGAAGWSSRDLTVPHEQETGPPNGGWEEYQFFSEDLSAAVVSPIGPFTPCLNAEGKSQPCLSEEASEQTPFLTTNFFDANVGEPCLPKAMHCARPLVSGCPAAGAPCPVPVSEHANVPPGTVFGDAQTEPATECQPDDHCGPHFIAATPDLGHLVLGSETPLTPGGSSGLYEWGAGKLTFIGKGKSFSTEEEGNTTAHGAHGISADGSRVIFRGESDGPHGEPLVGLLLRDTVTGETVKLGEGELDTANADDSRVFFTENGELYVFEDGGAGTSLAGTTTNLTAGAGLALHGERPGGVLGASENGEYVYFVSNGVLPGAVNGAGEPPSPGHCEGAASPPPGATCNLYVDRYYEATRTWKPTFVVALSAEDEQDWDPKLLRQPVRVSPNGRYVAFMSQRSLTGYDNRDAVNGRPDAEVYEYDADTDRTACTSCEPTGAQPIGVEYEKLFKSLVGGIFGMWKDQDFVAANLIGSEQISENGFPEEYEPRYLSDSGRLFFNTYDALVPQDSNGTQDVYEYEPVGIESPGGTVECSEATSTGSDVFVPRAHGCVALISSGDSPEESAFLDASESGGDVFFLTSAKLALQDRDAAYDVYDAHECTMQSPCSTAPVTPPPCDTEASCKASPAPQPSIYGVGPSETFTGAGNPAPAPAVATKTKPLTKAQKLAAALRACRRKSKKQARASCEASARKNYRAKKSRKAKKATAKGTKGAK